MQDLDIMKTRNRIGIAVSTIVVVAVVFVIYKISTFTLFDDELKKIVDIEVPNNDYKLRIYHVPSNATGLNYIQVRKLRDNQEDIIGNFERYDSLISYLLSDTLLELRLMNTISLRPTEDKVILKLND